MKFVLFVEGHTERKCIAPFLKRWLDPRLKQPVGINLVKFSGWSDLWKETPKKALNRLTGVDSVDMVAVIALLDLYGPNLYPAHLNEADQRLAWAVHEMQSRVNHKKFRMYFAVHELEAWILADVENLPHAVAKALPGKATRPEAVNFDEPPSKLLQKLYREKTSTTYQKVVTGSRLFSRVDPEVCYSKCPRLAAMLDEMLALAKQAGL